MRKLRHGLRFMLNRKLALGFAGWQHRWAEIVDQVESMRRSLRHMSQRELSRGWRKWAAMAASNLSIVTRLLEFKLKPGQWLASRFREWRFRSRIGASVKMSLYKLLTQELLRGWKRWGRWRKLRTVGFTRRRKSRKHLIHHYFFLFIHRIKSVRELKARARAFYRYRRTKGHFRMWLFRAGTRRVARWLASTGDASFRARFVVLMLHAWRCWGRQRRITHRLHQRATAAHPHGRLRRLTSTWRRHASLSIKSDVSRLAWRIGVQETTLAWRRWLLESRTRRRLRCRLLPRGHMHGVAPLFAHWVLD